MRKLNLFKYGLTALMMAFAMTLCFSCSSDDDEETPEEKKESKEGDKEKEKDKEKENPSSKADGTVDGHDYVIVAGIKWATENVGVVDGIEAIATDETYGYYYLESNAKKAVASWGDKWTLPTETQSQKLIDECKWEWKSNYSFGGKNMNGFLVSDKNNGNSIFLPAAGIYAKYINKDTPEVLRQGSHGYYWSKDFKNTIYFRQGDRNMESNSGYGQVVRPVIIADAVNLPPSKVDGQINGHDCVVLAGNKWATENVGAVDGVNAKFMDFTYGYYYTQGNAKRAAESWGGTWTIPTQPQWEKLRKECDWTWIDYCSFGGKTMNGFIVSDKNDSSKYIFFPAAGCSRDGSYLNDQSGIGYYWSANDNGNVCIDFRPDDNYGMMGRNDPSYGLSVRPISNPNSL